MRTFSSKGQITIFAIMAIILVVGIGVLVYIRSMPQLSPINPEIKPINSLIEGCVKSTGEDALIFVGQQGGYFEPPAGNVGEIPFYFSENKSHLPAKEKIESEISSYVNEMLPFCTKNFQDFNDFQIEADPYNVKTKTTILQGKIRFEVNWLTTIKKAEASYLLGKFSSETESRLDTIYSVLEKMISDQATHPATICLSCLFQLGQDNDMEISLEDYNDSVTFFNIHDHQVPVKNEPYYFVFAESFPVVERK